MTLINHQTDHLFNSLFSEMQVEYKWNSESHTPENGKYDKQHPSRSFSTKLRNQKREQKHKQEGFCDKHQSHRIPHSCIVDQLLKREVIEKRKIYQKESKYRRYEEEYLQRSKARHIHALPKNQILQVGQNKKIKTSSAEKYFSLANPRLTLQ